MDTTAATSDPPAGRRTRRRPARPGRRVVVLLGMHRSGTSVVMHLLHRLGVPIDGDLVPPARDNPRGFWESRRIVRAHDCLFAQFGLTWKHSLLGTPLPAAWWQRDETAGIRSELTEILRDGLAANGGLWGFKDPRTVRFLPLWREILAGLEAEPVWILAARHPAAVVDSLAPRSSLSRARCELLWIEHNLDALTHLDRKDLLVLSFERLLAEPAAELRRVLRRLPFLATPGEAALATVIATTLDPSMIHRTGANAGCTRTAIMIDGWLRALSEDRRLPPSTPAAVAAVAARDLTWLLDRDRSATGAPEPLRT